MNQVIMLSLSYCIDLTNKIIVAITIIKLEYHLLVNLSQTNGIFVRKTLKMQSICPKLKHSIETSRRYEIHPKLFCKYLSICEVHR